MMYPLEPSFIPIHLTGGIGDSIAAIHTLETLEAEGHQISVYSEHAEALKYFYNRPVIEGRPGRYTWRLELDSVARFKMTDDFSGFSVAAHKILFEKQRALFRETPYLGHAVKNHPTDKFLLTDMAKRLGIRVDAFPLYTLGLGHISPPLRLRLSACQAKKTITIHDGYDVNASHIVSGRATKTWKWEHWNRLVKDIKDDRPDFNIIQLGSKTSRQIDGVDECLINQTTITEAFDILKLSRLHIDTDSGLVHAATALGTPCAVIFGPTPASFYGYRQNVNLTSTDSCPGSCFHMKENWMDKCPVGYQSPQCMDDVTPDAVMEAIADYL